MKVNHQVNISPGLPEGGGGKASLVREGKKQVWLYLGRTSLYVARLHGLSTYMGLLATDGHRHFKLEFTDRQKNEKKPKGRTERRHTLIIL